MKWPAYPKYKDSGIEWLGDVPEGWDVLPLRYLFNNLDSRRIPVSGEDRAVLEKIYPYYGASGIIDHVEDFLFDETLILVAEDGANLLSRSSPLAFLASGKYWVNNHAHILKPLNGSIRYWASVLEVFDYSPLVTGAAQPKLTGERLGGIPLPLPPLPEQHAIASFLDRETGRIDLLVSKKRTLIERLMEKRTALISRTVTRGLPPAAARAAGLPENPTLKPSGIEWLGEVPEGWNVIRLRRLITRLDQGWSPNANSYPAAPGELGVLKLGAASKGKFYPEDNKALDEIPEGTAYVTPVVGDVLISRANTPDLVGDACVVNSSHPNLIIPDLLYRLRFNSNVHAQFVCWYILSKSGRAQVDNDARGSSNSMIKLGQGHLRSWAIPLPPLPEQQAIAAFLDAETAKLDALVAKVEAAIERLLEYRTALITAAVTGKIDVRGAIQ